MLKAVTPETPAHSRQASTKLCVCWERQQEQRESRVKSTTTPPPCCRFEAQKQHLRKKRFKKVNLRTKVQSDLQSYLTGMILTLFWMSSDALMLRLVSTKSAGLTRTFHADKNASVFKHQHLCSLLSAADFPTVAITASLLSVNAQKLSQASVGVYSQRLHTIYDIKLSVF